MKQHEKNAMAVAKYLESSPYVVEVRYPGKWVLPIIVMLLLCVCKAEPFDLSFHQYVCVRADNGCGPGGTFECSHYHPGIWYNPTCGVLALPQVDFQHA